MGYHGKTNSRVFSLQMCNRKGNEFVCVVVCRTNLGRHWHMVLYCLLWHCPLEGARVKGEGNDKEVWNDLWTISDLGWSLLLLIWNKKWLGRMSFEVISNSGHSSSRYKTELGKGVLDRQTAWQLLIQAAQVTLFSSHSGRTVAILRDTIFSTSDHPGP